MGVTVLDLVAVMDIEGGGLDFSVYAFHMIDVPNLDCFCMT